MEQAYEVRYCRCIDTWTGSVVGWGYFIVELWPVGTRHKLEPIKERNT
jgi:hypothetical protein